LIALKHIIHTIPAILFSFFASAQQYYIKGQVKDEGGAPLQNVTILLHSTGYLYSSGTEGSFGIISRELNDTLSFYRDGYVRQKLPVRATDFLDVKLKKQVLTKNANVIKLSSLTQNLKREVQQEWFIGEETYASLIENNFVNAADYPTTAITLNTDRASYSNVRRFLNAQATVPPDAVRLDEMLNYFNLNYTPPPQGKDFDLNATLTTCPWNKNNRLLFTQVNGRKIALDSLPPSHLVFLIDVSGSMDMPNRLPLLKSGFKALVHTLRAEDSVTIIVYGGAVGIALPITGGDEKQKIFKTIDSLQAGGSTPGESGIKIAYRMAKDHFLKDGNNRVILATDGDFNVGLRTETELEQLITDQRNNGIYLTCLGIGMGNYKDSKIQALAQKGNGNFAYIDSYAEAEKILLKEFSQTLYTIADDASFTVQFNPEYVKEYRLIGFDNKVGAIRDSTSVIEGGEIGSAFSGLLVFEIVPEETGLKSQRPASFTLKYKDPTGTPNQVEESPVINYTPFTQLSPCYQFASAVIMFGSVLRQSELIKTNWNEITTLARASADKENFSQQEFLALIEQAKKIYSKKKKKGLHP
jgi:Ca-activated chloride channel homolog